MAIHRRRRRDVGRDRWRGLESNSLRFICTLLRLGCGSGLSSDIPVKILKGGDQGARVLLERGAIGRGLARESVS